MPAPNACKASFELAGRILFLSDDPQRVAAQLQGQDLALAEAGPLRDNVSTDEITPAWVCYYYDELLGRYPYVGLKSGNQTPIGQDAVRAGGFEVTVAGQRYGKGSSREASPYAEKCAGIRLVIAQGFERIYRQNCHNLGLLTSTDLGLVERLQRGESIPIETFLDGLDPISAQVVRRGGLFAYTRSRLAGEIATAPLVATRPLAYAEKIILRAGTVPADASPQLEPGTGVFLRTDWRYSHEYVTPMAEAFLRAEFGADFPIRDPERVICFADHLAYIEQAMPAERRALGLLDAAQTLGRVQQRFCSDRGIRLHGHLPDRPGSEGICHTLMTDRYVLPGQVAVGSDSHTPHCGALGALAFGIGTTDTACAWLTGDVRLNVPPVCRIELHGALPPGVDAKDLVLHLLQLPYVRDGRAVGQVIEYGGSALHSLSTDARATLTNMVAEIGGLTGIVEPDAETQRYLAERRGLTWALEPWMCSDPGARYAHRLDIDCSTLEPMVARPGDPGNGIPIGQLDAPVAVNIAYGGSCTGGKREDLERYHEVLKWALDHGRRLAPGLRFYLQFGNLDIRRYCEERGMLPTFEALGLDIIEPGCGACLNGGPGVSTSPSDVTVSAINRNFPGRSGPGAVWLGSPSTVAASAIAGYLTSFEQLKA
jgi:3-isopropylmalate/(R)-2-methylmalate dehydratase large subunit